MLNELKQIVSNNYPLVFHVTNDRAILWNAALDHALMHEFGYDIDVPNEEHIEYPTLMRVNGRIGSPSFAVEIIEEGDELYAVFV